LAAERLTRWQRRQAALAVARQRREAALLAQSSKWITRLTLDDRIAQALANPVTMF